MTDPSKQRLIDVLIDMFVKERARVFYLTNEIVGTDIDWHDPDIQQVLMQYEEEARAGVPDPMRNHPSADDLRMDGEEMMPTNQLWHEEGHP